jgi:hypothetical protein
MNKLNITQNLHQNDTITKTQTIWDNELFKIDKINIKIVAINNVLTKHTKDNF